MKTSNAIGYLLLAIGCFFTSKQQAQVNLTSSLTACYTLDGNGMEPINSLSGTLSAVTATVDRMNNVASALEFSGNSSSYVRLPNDPLIKPIDGITVSGWYRPAILANMVLVFSKNIHTSFFTAYSLVVQNNGAGFKFRTYRQNGGGSDFADGTTVLTANNWYHVVFSINADSIKLYVDGVLEDSKPCNILNFNYDATRNVMLGGSGELNFNQPYTGSMDNMRFYNRVLTAAEVSILYAHDPSCSETGQSPVASFSVSAVQVCEGQAISLTDLSSNNPTSWNWQVSGGSSNNATSANPTYTFANAGNYTASLIASNNFGPSINTATQAIIVLANPTVTAVSTKSMYCPSEMIQISASGASSYTWSSGQTNPSISTVAIANSQVTYTVTGINLNGCIGTSSVLVRVADVCVGLNENIRELVASISPNPASDIIRVTSGNGATLQVKLYDLTGRLVSETKTGEKILMNIADFSTGLYYLEVTSGKESKTFKIIKE